MLVLKFSFNFPAVVEIERNGSDIHLDYTKASDVKLSPCNFRFSQRKESSADSVPSLRTRDPKIINPFIRRQQDTNRLRSVNCDPASGPVILPNSEG